MEQHLPALGRLPPSKITLLCRALQLGLCIRCSYRMTGYEARGFYSLPDGDLQLWARNAHQELMATVDLADFVVSTTTCPLCLGMMQRADELCTELVETTLKSSYDKPSQFSFGLNMPKSVLIRNVVAILAIVGTDLVSPGSPLRTLVRQVVDMKDALQDALRDKVSLGVSAEYTHFQGLKFTVEYCHEQSSTGVWDFFKKLPRNLYTNSHREGPRDEVSVAGIKDTLSKMTVSEFTSYCTIVVDNWTTTSPLTWNVTLSHEPLLLTGRYCKLHRRLPQTPWVLNGERKTATSLQELIAVPLLRFVLPSVDFDDPKLHASHNGCCPASDETEPGAELCNEPTAKTGDAPAAEEGDEPAAKRCKGVAGTPSPTAGHQKGRGFHTYSNSYVDGLYKFHSCGREDIDVRMLGNGRPFVVEVLDPEVYKFTESDLQKMMEMVNSSDPEERVRIHSLHVGTQKEFDAMNAQLDQRCKSYRCVVWAARDMEKHEYLLDCVNNCKNMVLAQRTPVRVMHRRSILVRDKTIHEIKCTLINRHWMVVDLTTSSGTYVKEFIHGDAGRTKPSLSELLQCRTEIIQLDVTDVL
mmetsp:Transcript_21251/g.38143  ORF Transcript_21251/g.38143 Transcript_21251/m.38143 type:complete len:582 (-) Transcript_21251:17-1762(-)